MTKPTMSKHRSAIGCNSAVSASPLQSQQSQQTAPPKTGVAAQTTTVSTKRYRPSSTSATMRIPHELRAQVKALVVAHRAKYRNDPDSWD